MTFFDTDDEGLSDISEGELFESLKNVPKKRTSCDVENQQTRPSPPPRLTLLPPASIPAQPNPHPDHVSWTSKHQPTTAAEIAINPKKYKELYGQIFESVTTGVGRVVILSGPAGSSKTTALDQVIQDISKDLKKPAARIEWTNPSFISTVPSPEVFYKAVSEFMYLRQDDSVRVITVEDLPNIMHFDTRVWFRRAVEEYLNYLPSHQMVPLVFVISESDNNEAQSYAESYTVESIFSRELLNHPRIRRVKFQAVAKTFLEKALLEILLKEAGPRYVTVGSTKAISRKLKLAKRDPYGPCLEVAYVLGDVRSAINALEFFHRSKTKPNDYSSDSYIRPDNVSFFRAMGRVFYGTKKDTSQINHDIIGGLLSQWGDDLGARNNILDYLFALGVKVGVNHEIGFISQVSETSSIGDINASGMLPPGESIEYLLRTLHNLFLKHDFPKQFGSGNLFKQGIEARQQMIKRRHEVDDLVHQNRWRSREGVVLFEDFYAKKILGVQSHQKPRNDNKEEDIFELTGKPFTLLSELGEKLDLEDDHDLLEAMGMDDDDDWD